MENPFVNIKAEEENPFIAISKEENPFIPIKKAENPFHAIKAEEQNSGLVEPGNIDLGNRPKVKNPDGSISTVRSTSFIDSKGRAVLVPMVMDNGTIVSPRESWQNYLKTGKHLGIFDNTENATKYAIKLHNDQAALSYSQPPQLQGNLQPSSQSYQGPAIPESNAQAMERHLAEQQFRQAQKVGKTSAMVALPVFAGTLAGGPGLGLAIGVGLLAPGILERTGLDEKIGLTPSDKEVLPMVLPQMLGLIGPVIREMPYQNAKVQAATFTGTPAQVAEAVAKEVTAGRITNDQATAIIPKLTQMMPITFIQETPGTAWKLLGYGPRQQTISPQGIQPVIPVKPTESAPEAPKPAPGPQPVNPEAISMENGKIVIDTSKLTPQAAPEPVKPAQTPPPVAPVEPQATVTPKAEPLLPPEPAKTPVSSEKWVDLQDKGQIPGEPIKILGTQDNPIAIMNEAPNGKGVTIDRADGTHLYNPITQSPIFDSQDEAIAEYEKQEKEPNPFTAIKAEEPIPESPEAIKKELSDIESIQTPLDQLPQETLERYQKLSDKLDQIEGRDRTAEMEKSMESAQGMTGIEQFMRENNGINPESLKGYLLPEEIKALPKWALNKNGSGQDEIAQNAYEAGIIPSPSFDSLMNAIQGKGRAMYREQFTKNQINSENFKNWFGDSKVTDETGKPKIIYSGHSNVELYGTKYNPSKGTAGGFYATEDPEIASNYSIGKIGGQEYYEKGNQYRFPDKSGKMTKKIWQVEMTPELVKKIDELKLKKDQYDNWEYPIAEMDRYINENKNYDKNVYRMSLTGGSHNLQNIHDFYEYMGYTASGGINHEVMSKTKNPVEAFENNQFEDTLDALGLSWQSYERPTPGVLPVYLKIRNPIDTSKPFPKDLLDALEVASKYERNKGEEGHWTKEYSLKTWVKSIEEGSEFWPTQIPKKALPIIKRFGYDGIKDTGGKSGGKQHAVWIAFEPEQIKSATGNKGTFNPEEKNMLYRKGEQSLDTLTPEAQTKIKQIVKKIIGKDDVVFVDKILQNPEATGMYYKGDITINKSTGLIEGLKTAKHEPVHYIFDNLLEPDLKEELINEAKKESGETDDFEAEEYAARKFEDYAENRKGVFGRLKQIFDMLIARLKRLLGMKGSLKDFFAKVNSGEYAKEVTPETTEPAGTQMEPQFRKGGPKTQKQIIAEIQRRLESAQKKEASDAIRKKDLHNALEEAKKEPSDKKFGAAVRTYFVGERDSRIAEANQLAMKIGSKTLVPDPLDQEALTILRDFKGRPGELEKWLDSDNEYIQPLKPIIEKALNPTPAMLQADKLMDEYFTKSLEEGKSTNMLESSIKPEEYITHLLYPKAELQETKKNAGLYKKKIGRYTPFSKERYYPTVLHAIADGVKPKTLNATSALSVYGDKHGTAMATRLLIDSLKNTELGKWGYRGSENIDPTWEAIAPESNLFKNTVPFIDEEGNPQVAFQNLYAPKKVAGALRPITDPSYLNRVPFFMSARIYQSYIKAAELGLSVFHMKALNITALNNEGLINLIKNYNQDMNAPEFQDIEKTLIKAGGTTSILGRESEVYRAIRKTSQPTTYDKIRNLPPVKQIDKVAEAITDETFGVVQRKIKVMDFSITDAAWMKNHPTASEQEHFTAQKSIAKELNAAYGGLQWEILGVNKPTLEILKAIMLAPDWTFSNVFNAKYSFEGGPAGAKARRFWASSLALGLSATAAMSLLISGKLSNRPTEVYLGKDPQGRDIYQNMFFVGAPGDAIKLMQNIADYGLVEGLGQSIAGKVGPIGRTGVQFLTNRNYLGQTIVPKGSGIFKGTYKSAASLIGNLGPVPFSVSNFIAMATDPQQRYITPEYITTLLGGTRPRHVEDKGSSSVESIPTPSMPSLPGLPTMPKMP